MINKHSSVTLSPPAPVKEDKGQYSFITQGSVDVVLETKESIQNL